MPFLVVIPARISSKRFYGKPLQKILGKPMVQWVYEKAEKVFGKKNVLIATDSEEILKEVKNFGGSGLLTSKDCKSGTDRVAEVAERYFADYYINLQGDEPLIRPETLEKLKNKLLTGNYEIVTLDYPLNEEDARDPNIVKVVKDKENFALYFSRSQIPYPRGLKIFRKHIGIYGYKRETLLNFVKLPPSPLEEAEGLEQLRALYNKIEIYVEEAPYDSISVDTPEDLKKVEEILRKEGV